MADLDLGIVGSERTNIQAIVVGIKEWKGNTGVDFRRCFKVNNK